MASYQLCGIVWSVCLDGNSKPSRTPSNGLLPTANIEYVHDICPTYSPNVSNNDCMKLLQLSASNMSLTSSIEPQSESRLWNLLKPWCVNILWPIIDYHLPDIIASPLFLDLPLPLVRRVLMADRIASHVDEVLWYP
jgi:hypothetical protein